MIHRKINSLISVDNQFLVRKRNNFIPKPNMTDNLSNYKSSVLELLISYNQSQYNYYSLSADNFSGMNTFPLFFNKYSQSFDPDFFSQEVLYGYENNPLFVERHSKRVGQYCYQLGKALGLKGIELETIELAGLLHDIGKTSIPKNILNKPEALTTEEWKIMKTHVLIGYDILNSSTNFKGIAQAARSHHERIDGKGYPDRLKGDEIPFEARLISIVDAYEAMTNDRPYRKALPKQVAIQELIKHSGTQFDPDIVEVFISDVLQ